uniref:Uncharacterized protein n=1 Tax=Molossus molossus TaxID=27622 RepID=A0A7J8CRZ5_MOLMO|nr:hypothetical protein HJG59_009800 [Molossus molossus]
MAAVTCQDPDSELHRLSHRTSTSAVLRAFHQHATPLSPASSTIPLPGTSSPEGGARKEDTLTHCEGHFLELKTPSVRIHTTSHRVVVWKGYVLGEDCETLEQPRRHGKEGPLHQESGPLTLTLTPPLTGPSLNKSLSLLFLTHGFYNGTRLTG